MSRDETIEAIRRMRDEADSYSEIACEARLECGRSAGASLYKKAAELRKAADILERSLK